MPLRLPLPLLLLLLLLHNEVVIEGHGIGSHCRIGPAGATSGAEKNRRYRPLLFFLFGKSAAHDQIANKVEGLLLLKTQGGLPMAAMGID